MSLTDLPSEWNLPRLADVFEAQLGKMVSGKARSGISPRPYLRNLNVQWGAVDTRDVIEMDFNERERKKFRLRKGDLLMCEGGVPGRTAIWRDEIAECYYQKAIHRLRPRDGNALPEFFLYWFRYAFDVTNFFGVSGASSTIAHLPAAQLKSLTLPVPPLGEQRQIAAVLSAVQRAIERQERLIALSSELKKALMHKLFTEGTRGEPLKQTEIGPVPQSWTVEPLGFLFSREPSNGLYRPQSDYGRGTHILRIDDFSNDGDIVMTASNRVDVDEADSLRFGLAKDDIVLNRVNSLSHLGKAALIGSLSEPMLFESNMMRFRVDETRLRPGFAFRLLNSAVCKSQIVGMAKRAVAQSSVNQGDVSRLLIALPPNVRMQDEILVILEAAEAKGAVHSRMRASFQHLFRTLLHQLMIKAAELLFKAAGADKPTVLILIDRNELEDQMLRNLAMLGIGNIQHAHSIAALNKLLKEDYRGIIVSTIHNCAETRHVEPDCRRDGLYRDRRPNNRSDQGEARRR